MKEFINKKAFWYLFILILVIKFLCLGLFSSDYQNLLFIPFVNHFVEFHDNPWQWAYQTNSSLEFPYHPLMLYVFSIGAYFIKILHTDNVFITNILFKLPILFADLGIFIIFLKMTKNKWGTLLYYFLSPIVFYACYMHSQLDIVPVAAVLYSFYLLKKRKIYQASFWFVISCCLKLTAVILFPVFLVYLYKHTNKIKTIISFVCSILIYFAASVPYIFTEGYRNLVLFNPKQALFFNLHVNLLSGGDEKQTLIYIPLLCILLIYLRFTAYKKINGHLLDSFCCLAVSVFLIFVPPSSPAWLVWLVPFAAIFVINFADKNKQVLYAYIASNAAYLLYFLFFHIGDYADLTFLAHSVNLKSGNLFLKNCAFTLLEATLIAVVYLTYRTAIKNNSVYKKEKAVLIGISGDSGAGKTILLEDLESALGNNLLTLEGDGAHKWERGNDKWKEYTHLDPKANYLYQQMDMLNKLKNFKSAYYREYNHSTGNFETKNMVKAKQFVALAGLHTFYLPKMRKILDLKIYLNTQKELRNFWKIQRDKKERGYSDEKIKEAIKNREEDSIKYIVPQKEFADVVINYFTDEKENNTPPEHLKLRIDIDASVSLEVLIEHLKYQKATFEWDYSDDLKMQYIILYKENGLNNLSDIINKQIDNVEEILRPDYKIESGYRGLVQYILLTILSSKMKEDND